jgi:hypothetical protein
MLADPDAIPASDPRAALAPHLTVVRDAMRRHPELVAGTRDRRGRARPAVAKADQSCVSGW